jgi:hypothetical protein
MLPQADRQIVRLTSPPSLSQLFPRKDTTACSSVLGTKTASFCDSGDTFCDSGTGANGVQIHLSYVNKYGGQATSFVVGQLGNASAAAGAA